MVVVAIHSQRTERRVTKQPLQHQSKRIDFDRPLQTIRYAILCKVPSSVLGALELVAALFELHFVHFLYRRTDRHDQRMRVG